MISTSLLLSCLLSCLSPPVSGTDPASLCSSLSPCSRPLGLESGQVGDQQITASSSYSSSVEGRMGRLNREEGGGAWCPSSVLTNTSQEWLQVELGRQVLVTGLVSQGRWDRGLGQEWTQTLQVFYWSYGLWVLEGETRQANTDTFTPVVIRLGQADSVGVVTDKIRAVPVTQHPRTVCLRLELCGCPLQDEHHQVGFDGVHDEVHDVKEELEGRGVEVPAVERDENSSPSLMSVVIGVLVTIILILTTVIIFILCQNSLLSPPTTSTSSEHKLCPDQSWHYSNDSSSEYSRPLLGYQHQHRILWDLSFPGPQSAPHNNRHHQVQRQTAGAARGNFRNLAVCKINNFPHWELET